MNTNNNNSSLQIESAPSLLLGIPYGDGCVLEGEMLTMSLPAPVIVTDIEPPLVKEDAPQPPTTTTNEEREIPTGTDVSVVRTRLGFFEQLSSFVIAEGIKRGIPKSIVPPAKKDETTVEEKQETHANDNDTIAREGEDGPCDGAECIVSEDGCHTWATATRCSKLSMEKCLEGCQEPISVVEESDEATRTTQPKICWRPIDETSEISEENNDSSDDEGFVFLPDMEQFNCNNNNVDPESRFNDFVIGNDNGFNAYQPSAIAAQAERRPPFERYIPAEAKCRIGGGKPGAPAAVEGGKFSKLSADKAGVPWGAKKQRHHGKLKYINQEPYQTLNPSGRWTYATQQMQPANKQATVERKEPFPRYIAKSQQCKARPELRKKTTDQGVGTSCKASPVKRKRRTPINLDAVRCNCPGLYPVHPSQGPGNYWDEEDDDEAILAEMCPGDDLEECGQGVDNVFPLEEWADEWEDGVVSGDCLPGGKLAPGTLEVLPWENPCLEELFKRKARIQELRNKRWAALDKARIEAKKLQQEANKENSTEEDKKKARMATKELTRKALNEHGQKTWSILSWFTPTKWAVSDCNDCAPSNRAGKTCTRRTSSGPNVCVPEKANQSANNISGDDSANLDTTFVAIEGTLKSKSTTEIMADYEWDQMDDSDEEYNKRINESRAKTNIEERKKRIQRLREKQRLQAERERKGDDCDSNNAGGQKRKGVISTVFGFFGGNDSNNNSGRSSAYVMDEEDVGAENANNNAANRCFRPCPPCPQGDCPPPPFECPCNDIHCPKKLKANKENVQKTDSKAKGLKAGTVGNVDVSIDVTDDLRIEGIDISVKKPPPDLSLGCSCGDAECKKKKCNPINKNRTYEVCELRNGKMALQEACPVQETVRDICDRDETGEGKTGPKECPCTDDECRKKKCNQEGFVFLYPSTDKIKLDDKGCPLQQQIRCVVTQIGDRPPQVAVTPVGNKGLHCAPVPPCPCPEWERLEIDNSHLSGNSWGDDMGGETDCAKPTIKKEVSKDCGSSKVEGGISNDEFEWDFWEEPCGDEVKKDEISTPADVLACRDFMANRTSQSDNTAAAIVAALEAFEYEKVKKERAKIEAATRKRRIAEMREMGMSEAEIVDQLCSDRVPGPCEITGEFPPQESCAPNPPPPGCPCPDPACPKRAPFDYQMHDTDLAKIKNPYDYKNTEKYLKSEAYKTMDCELKYPTYKDVNKSYPKRQKTKCPCPECVTTTQKAWAAVEKAKIGPPPDCPCKDAKCPKKPKKAVENEKKAEKIDPGVCAMPTYYPAQSGCPEVLRCDLLRDPCGTDGCNSKKPEDRYRCHTCSIRHPMPKQEACPDYDCKNCKLVCHKCGCEPKKCEKCEDAKKYAIEHQDEKPHDPCPPCTVMGPLPKQTDCELIHPCDDNHPCMCDPNTGEPIDAESVGERCGPCDFKNHDMYPIQGGCAAATRLAAVDPCAPADSSTNAESLDLLSAVEVEATAEISEDALEDNQTTANNENEGVPVVSGPIEIEESTTKFDQIPTNTELEAGHDQPLIAADSEYPSSQQDVVKDTTEPAMEVVSAAGANVEQEEMAIIDLEASQSETVTSSASDEVTVNEENVDVVIKEQDVSPQQIEEVEEEGEELPKIESDCATVEQAVERMEEEKTEVTEGAETLECHGGEREGTFIDVKKGTTANVKVEFRVVGLELTEEELKAVGDAFTLREAEEAIVSKEALEEELKRAALEAVKEKMKSATPAADSSEAPEQLVKYSGQVADKFSDMEENCAASCSFSGMEISAYLPAWMKPKAKCHQQPKNQLALPLSSSRAIKRWAKKDTNNGLNAIDGLNNPRSDVPRRGIIHRVSQLKPGHDEQSGGRNWLAKKQELVLVNNDDGAVDIIEFDRLSKENRASIDGMFNLARPSVAAK